MEDSRIFQPEAISGAWWRTHDRPPPLSSAPGCDSDCQKLQIVSGAGRFMCRWRKIVSKIRCKGWAVDSLTQMRRKRGALELFKPFGTGNSNAKIGILKKQISDKNDEIEDLAEGPNPRMLHIIFNNLRIKLQDSLRITKVSRSQTPNRPQRNCRANSCDCPGILSGCVAIGHDFQVPKTKLPSANYLCLIKIHERVVP